MSDPRGTTIPDALTAWIENLMGSAAATGLPVFMLAGAQGSGKTTVTAKLRNRVGARLLCVSLDDFYLSRGAREKLAADVDPLFITRGPPGTHDLALLSDVITRAGSAKVIRVPVFDKLRDDRLKTSHWRRHYGPFDGVLLEGWCLGVTADSASLDDPPLNAVERQDTGQNWRRYQEEQLLGPYATCWQQAAGFAYLLAPDFQCVYEWRLQQELGNRGVDQLSQPEQQKLAYFVTHFERLTRRMLAGGRLPGLALHLDETRQLLPQH